MLALAGVGNDRAPLLVTGVVLAGLAVLGQDSTRLSIRALGAELTLERQPPSQASDYVLKLVDDDSQP